MKCNVVLMKLVFESRNINFIRIDKSLLNDYLKMVNDYDHVGKFIGRTEPIEDDNELIWIQKKLDDNDKIYSMIEKKTGDFIGNIEFMNIHDGEAELGISITKDKQNQGFGPEAILRMLEYGKNALKLKRLFLKAFLFNDRAIHVYKKCGFIEYARDEKEIYMEVINFG